MKPRITIAIITAGFVSLILKGWLTIEEALFLEIVLLMTIALTLLLIASYRQAGHELEEECEKNKKHYKEIHKDD